MMWRYFTGDEPVIFDFDCMGYGWRAYDICVYAHNESFLDEEIKYYKKNIHNGMIVFGYKNKKDIISITDKIIVKPEYDLCDNYSDGIAVAKDFTDNKNRSVNYISYAFDTIILI
jgi:hypothetical protein